MVAQGEADLEEENAAAPVGSAAIEALLRMMMRIHDEPSDATLIRH